ncbi:MAG TPA: winged helix-turn-helix domain-containing protein, partial [Candidatus Methylacidiphilales bacterium]|nr:winged helix-turn-helix domain-containing protein [Candidatus Methylacidiphilales bacterium]
MIAELTGCSRGSVQTWLKAYTEGGGLDAVVARRKPGSRTSPMQAAEVQEQFQEKIDLGAFRTAGQAQRWLQETFGIRLAVKSVYYWLKKVLRAALRVPRPVHEKKNPQATDTFLATLHDVLASLPLEPDRPVRIWVQDEARFG